MAHPLKSVQFGILLFSLCHHIVSVLVEQYIEYCQTEWNKMAIANKGRLLKGKLKGHTLQFNELNTIFILLWALNKPKSPRIVKTFTATVS